MNIGKLAERVDYFPNRNGHFNWKMPDRLHTRNSSSEPLIDHHFLSFFVDSGHSIDKFSTTNSVNDVVVVKAGMIRST